MTGSYVIWKAVGMTHIRWFREASDAQHYWTMLHEGGVEATIRGAGAYAPPAAAK